MIFNLVVEISDDDNERVEAFKKATEIIVQHHVLGRFLFVGFTDSVAETVKALDPE